eukprot:TRINITY_DN7433_c0_g1_i1.p1 TRINITY_DN7433_c0_g1~~TRINITY_DN7433_c0_g1_i1.p1  ORF type:complete len:205 (+),score=65.60 TRINITY_DN7433_c0_g1_i1:108-722(+)
MHLFGTAAPTTTDSIGEMKESINSLEKREELVKKQANQAVASAKEKYKKGDKKGALLELRKMQMLEKQIEGISLKRVHLETRILALQTTSTNQGAVEVLKTARDGIQPSVNDKLVDEVSADMDNVNGDLSFDGGCVLMNEDEVKRELNAMLEQMIKDEELAVEPNKGVTTNDAIGGLPSSKTLYKDDVHDDNDENELTPLEAEL